MSLLYDWLESGVDSASSFFASMAEKDGAIIDGSSLQCDWWHSDIERYRKAFALIPCAVPPWDAVFVEFRRPETCDCHYPPKLGVESACALVVDGRQDGVALHWRHVERRPHERYQSIYNPDIEDSVSGFGVLTREGILDFDSVQLHLAELVRYRSFYKVSEAEADAYYHSVAMHSLQHALRVFALTHCSNIEPIESLLPRPVRRRAMRNGIPIVKQYTLNIKTSRLPINNEHGNAESQYSKPLHLCRGHFRTYTTERPMGRNKVAGTFWIRQHVRGSLDNGLILKDYRIQPDVKP